MALKVTPKHTGWNLIQIRKHENTHFNRTVLLEH